MNRSQLHHARTAPLALAAVLFLCGSAAPQSTKLSDPLAGEVWGLWWTAFRSTGDHVVYQVLSGSQTQLHTVTRGGPSARLDDSGTGSVVEYWFPTSSGEQVVYSIRRGAFGPYDVFSVPADGSAAPTPLVANSATQANLLELDETLLFYDLDGSELFAVAIDGGSPPITLSSDYWGGPPTDLCPGDTHVIFPEYSSGAIQLSAAPVDGSQAPVRIAGRRVISHAFHPDGTSLIFRGRAGQGPTELLTAPWDGSGTPVKLSGSLPPGGDVIRFVLSPDGSFVVYLAALDLFGKPELYRVPADGSEPPVKVNGPAAGDVSAAFDVSADSRHIVYIAAQDVGYHDELYSAPADGSGPPAKLNAALPGFGDVLQFALAPDARHVVYRSDQEADEVKELFRVPIEGGTAPVKLNGPLVAGGDVKVDFALSADGCRVFYLADQETDQTTELFSVPLLRPGESTKHNGPIVAAGGDVEYWVEGVGAFAGHLVYSAVQETDFFTELYLAAFEPRPRSLSASSGGFPGGETLTVHGTGFTPETEVTFGSVPARSVTFVSADELRVVVPSLEALPRPTRGPSKGKGVLLQLGDVTVDVVVTDGVCPRALPGAYTYRPGR